MNGELLCELIRAHYDSDTERFDLLLTQIIESQRLTGSAAIGERLADIRDKQYGSEEIHDLPAAGTNG